MILVDENIEFYILSLYKKKKKEKEKREKERERERIKNRRLRERRGERKEIRIVGLPTTWVMARKRSPKSVREG